MTITIITCTRDRPEAFKLCEHYMRRQTVQPTEWLVLDDGNTPVQCTMGQKHMLMPEARTGTSMINKLRAAFAPGVIKTDAVAWVEDDDFYAPNWIETCVKELETCQLFGEGRAYYYNVRERWWYQHANMDHASLCATAIRKELYPMVRQLCMGKSAFIDVPLWARSDRRQRRLRDPMKHGGKCLVVGIKAMPGTLGYSGAHSVRDRAAKDDLGMEKLAQLLGSDHDLYEPFWKDYVKLNLKVPVHTETGRARGANWIRWIGHLTDKPGVTGLEIGTFKGESAEFMCENVFTGAGATYFCVDPFTGSIEHQGVVDCSTLEKESRDRLAPFKAAKIIKGYSQDVLTHWTGPTLDFLYVDGDHTSMAALRDAVLGFELLKVGGVLVWDDVEWTVFPRPQDCPKLGVESFLAAYADFIEVLPMRGWQVAVKKIK